MILRNSLYSIIQQAQAGASTTYQVELHADHVIYQAHFPGEPITPGVCIIQLARELMEDYWHRPLVVSTVKNAKFLSVISPNATPVVTCVLNSLTVDADHAVYSAKMMVMDADRPLAKLSLICTAHDDRRQ